MNPQAEIRSATGVPAPATDGPTTTLDKIVARNGNPVEIPLLEGSTADITTINSTDVNADNIIANNIVNTSGATASGSRRQTVLSGRKASVHADFIERSTGLSVVAKASPSEPIVTTIASGWDTYGKPVNFNNAITSDITFSGLTPNATNFLGLKKNGNILDQVVTLLPPVYGNIFTSDRDFKINATFNGNDGDTTFIDEYNNTFRSYGTNWAISNNLANQFNGMNTWRCEGGSGTNRIEYVPKFQIRQLEQFTMELFFKTDNVVPVSGTYQNILFAAGGTANTSFRFWLYPSGPTAGRPYFYLSIDESSWLWANEPMAIMTGPIVATPGYVIVPGYTQRTGGLGNIRDADGVIESNKWYHFAWVFDGLHHNMYLNGFLIRSTRDFGYVDNHQVTTYTKIAELTNIYLGADSGSNSEKLMGNISNFAFHPYAKYQSRKSCNSAESALLRDTFVPPTPPFISDTNTNRYFQESEAIYLNFENTAHGDITTKDKYGRTLFCHGNSQPSVNTGCYIETITPVSSAKSGSSCLRFSGYNSNFNSAYIKAPVWGDTWTVEFWSMDNSVSAGNKTHVSVVYPGYLVGYGFQILSDGNSIDKIRYTINLSNVDDSPNVLQNSTGYVYNIGVYNHIAVTYDGLKYRFFINGILILSTSSQLRLRNGSYFIFGKHPSNQYWLDGRLDEFAYVPYCKYGSDYDITPFTPAASFASSMPDQYAFDVKKMQMYKGSDGAYVAENTLFIGETTTLDTQVEDITTYALNGEYQERFAFDGYAPSVYGITRKHNLGVPSRFIDIEDYGIMNAKVSDSYSAVGSKIKLFMSYASVSSFPLSDVLDRKYYFMAKSNNGVVGAGRVPTGIYFSISGSQAYFADFLIQAKRTF